MDFNASLTPMEQKFYQLCRQVVEGRDLELYHLEYRQNSGLLRVMIQNPATRSASIENCVEVDRALTPFIESESWMPGRLTLEVSSPGIDRPLHTPEHFRQAQGGPVALVLRRPMEDGQRRVQGVLRAVGDDGIHLEVGGKELTIPVGGIVTARKVYKKEQ